MKHAYMTILFSIATLVFWTPSAQAECACVCLEGSERTVCDDQSEASARRNMCVDGTWQTDCPSTVGEIDTTIEISTPSDTANCVRARVWDPLAEAYREVNVCDLAG